jgi:dihydroorotate dehydrogenase electron transfer subunit
MKKFIHDLKIVSNKTLNQSYYLLELTHDLPLPECLPGQFAEVLVTGQESVFLRRPLSIHDIDYKKNTISFLVQIVGKGTNHLSEIKSGDLLNVVYPLGQGFNPVKSGEKALLIGGGCGIAPLLYLARVLKSKGVEVDTLVGVRTKSYLIEIEKYHEYGNVLITTEDGSEGTKGYVVNHPVFENLNDYKKIYTCGPEVMMKAIAKRAAEAGVDCEVSLENTMACGIGACLCCVTETKEGNKCVCTDGPVFNINDLKW